MSTTDAVDRHERTKNFLTEAEVERSINGAELQVMRRYLRSRDSRLPWLFVTERGGQFTRQGIYYLVRCISDANASAASYRQINQP